MGSSQPQVVEFAAPLAASYARNNQRQQAQTTLLLWRSSLNPADLDFIGEYYRFPYRWSVAHRDVRNRLFDGLRIAVLPQDINVSTLIETLRGDDFFERLRAVRTLGWFGPDARQAISELIAALADEEKEIRKQSVISLGKIGPSANAAIPHLRAMQDEPLIGHHAKESLQQISDCRQSRAVSDLLVRPVKLPVMTHFPRITPGLTTSGAEGNPDTPIKICSECPLSDVFSPSV